MSVLSIVIPVYNEGKNIRSTLQQIRMKITRPSKIVIIYDFNEDNTLPVVNALDDKANIQLVKNRYGRGVLNAIKTGFDVVEDGAVLVVMADLADDFEAVEPMLQKLDEGYDIVCGSRYMRGGRQEGGPWLKGLLSRLAGVSLHVLAGIPTHDITNSFKLYTTRILRNITIESTGGFELGMEIVVKAYIRGFRIAEVPSIWRDRQMGQSRFKLWAWLPKYLFWYGYALVYGLPRRLMGPGKAVC